MRWSAPGIRSCASTFVARRLAQEFFRFEIATAVAGAVLGINPFDQPDVEASKVATREMTRSVREDGRTAVGAAGVE